MAKKKKKQPQQLQEISPEKYIKTKARSLPLKECLVAKDWEALGLCPVGVAREHKSGNVTFGFYLVDTYCLGVKDSVYQFNYDRDEYEKIKSRFFNASDYEAVPYDVVHNIIYGAVEYAGELGIKPDKSFAISKYLLEEDTEDIPLIEYEFGKDGKPFLVANDRLQLNTYLPVLEKNVGEGNFSFEVLEDEYDEYDDFTEDDLEIAEEEHIDFMDKLKTSPMFENYRKSLMQTHVAYGYPGIDYPKELILTHPELNIFFLNENLYRLKKEDIDQILSLPRQTLIEDMEHIILYEIGQVRKSLDENVFAEEDEINSAIMHALYFLGELRAAESLPVALEVLRQNDDFLSLIFGDSGSDVLPLSLYYLGKDQLGMLMDYAKEPHLYAFFRYYVFEVINIIQQHEPERREELISWFRDILIYYIENVKDSTVYDATLMGLVTSVLIDIKAKELLPEIKQLYDLEEVDLMSCGPYEHVLEDIESESSPLHEYQLLNIYERYDLYERKWARE